ncbi:DUF4190 domain-containing protein [Gordonia shandongensis]|uniref:DUF4190 domain-containing protein n=1 Tax=Gordonia shandongensis TaxID=376351 RepID=UPI0004080898|nr:DUF4190 domain-containing protein [Gordonia shandongensis]
MTSPAASSATDFNWNAVWAFLMSAVGVLSPFGIWLGYRSRARIDRDGTLGREFATAAIVVGYLWVAFLVLGALAYLWILL